MPITPLPIPEGGSTCFQFASRCTPAPVCSPAPLRRLPMPPPFAARLSMPPRAAHCRGRWYRQRARQQRPGPMAASNSITSRQARSNSPSPISATTPRLLTLTSGDNPEPGHYRADRRCRGGRHRRHRQSPRRTPRARRRRSRPTTRSRRSDANDVGKLPDQNVAEAVQRLPGLSVANDQGEGRYVIIRGIDPNLVNVTLNGQTLPAPEPGGRVGQARRSALGDDPVGQRVQVAAARARTPMRSAARSTSGPQTAFDRSQAASSSTRARRLGWYEPQP